MTSHAKPEYEFGGPLGASAIVVGLPVLLYVFAFGCNDVTGCPVPSLLSPQSLSWEQLRSDIGWPSDGVWGLFSWKVTAVVLGYYALSLVLDKLLPGQEVYGTKLVHHGRPLKYRLNAFSTSIVQLAACAIGTYFQGANFIVWTYIADNYLQLLTANILIAYALSLAVYLHSFSVPATYPNDAMRELAAGGATGNPIYDFYIGRELNPRTTIPLLNLPIDIKTWCEMRPGLTGWLLLDLAYVAQQYRNYGRVSDSIVFTACVQGWYVLAGQYSEAGVLTMMDITTDGFGFMLCFGDLVWVPFLYSTQCRYLAAHPVSLGPAGVAAVAAVFAAGLYIFRAANAQKNVFRTRPDDPSVKGLSYIQTKRGTRLLTDGWWGVSRHINYFGDWLQASPFSMPTGLAGYAVLPAGGAAASAAAGHVHKMLDGREVVQGEARGWGALFTYFYVLYFAILLMHRERRDDAMCAKKYGEDWEKYKKMVRWRILPWVY
ncbi:erg24, C-14 sterol reductase [Diplodia seriata]|uniref:Delta(14)-sterol reductase n=1 Tax=Diplodia seriata TaxID=420778 RepID=A0ABR3CNV3_9PEZI